MAEAEFTVKGTVSEWKIEAQYFSVGPIFWTIPTPLLVRSHSSGVSIDQWNFGKLATARPTGRPEPALNEIVQPGFYCYPMFLTHGRLPNLLLPHGGVMCKFKVPNLLLPHGGVMCRLKSAV